MNCLKFPLVQLTNVILDPGPGSCPVGRDYCNLSLPIHLSTRCAKNDFSF